MPVDPALNTLARDQKRWSLTADRLKKEIFRARLAVLILGVGGAILETLGAQIHQSHTKEAVRFGYLGAAALASLAVIRQWKLGREQLQSWILARAASESFKKEMYLYRAAAGPYSGQQPGAALIDRREEILGKVRPIQNYAIEPKDSQFNIPGPLDADGYKKERIDGQIKYFRDSADKYSAIQSRFGAAEFILAFVGALLGAALTMTGKQAYGAWVAVITTITGAVTAHLLAQRYEQLTVTYRATADRLAGNLARHQVRNGTLSELAEQTEATLFEQNQGWIAGADELVRDSGSRPPEQTGSDTGSPVHT